MDFRSSFSVHSRNFVAFHHLDDAKLNDKEIDV